MALPTYSPGNTTAVSQVTTFTPSNVETGDIFTITLTAEDGSTTQSESFTATAGTVGNVTAGLQSVCAASTKSMFQRITWTENGSLVTGTAKVAGIPFYASSSTTDGGVSNTQALAVSTTTPNAGQNDWNTAGNWSDSTVPDAESVRLAGSYPILFGLDQTGATKHTHLDFGGALTAGVGDYENRYYLQVDSTEARFAANARVMATGDLDTVYVSSVPAGADMVMLGGDIDNLYVASTPAVRGGIDVKASTTLDNVYFAARSGYMRLGESLSSLDLIEQSGGAIDLYSDLAASGVVNVSGGKFSWHDGPSSTSITVNIRGGYVYFTFDGTVSGLTVNQYGGHFDLSNLAATSLTMTVNLYGGTFDARTGMSNLTLTVNNFGGTYHENI